jgi:hypothetical protein
MEERVAKLEQELKQIRLQVACQERRIAELEAKAMRPKGKDRAIKSPAQRLLPSIDEAGPACQVATKRSAASPASGNDEPESIVPDQIGQARAPRPGQAVKKRKPRKRRRKGGSTREPGSAYPDPCSLTTDRTVGKSGGSVPEPGDTLLAIQGSDASVPSAVDDQGPATHASVGTAARIRKYAVLYAQKTPLNRAPRVAGVDPMALLQFMIVIEIWKTRLIPVLIWIMQHLKN